MGPDYEKIVSLLTSNSIFSSVSELHGVVSGQICAGVSVIKPGLTRQLMGLEEEFPAVVEQLLMRLGNDVTEQMQAGDYSFCPLLPQDEEELSIRLHALGEWCEGFNIGFGGGFGKSDQSVLEETREVIKDFAAIAEIEDSPEDDPALEENEENYMEVVEYVRMAAATVFMQNSNGSAKRNASDQRENNIH